MKLDEIIRNRLMADENVTKGLAVYAGEPAIFTPSAPSDTAEGWQGQASVPRMVFVVDESPDEERKSQGIMILKVYAKKNGTYDMGAAAAALRECLLNVILTQDDENSFGLAFHCIHEFELDGAESGGTKICGQELQLDLLEYPPQKTMDPDPIDGLNEYLKKLYPEALVLWRDPAEQAEKITAERPIFYCRLENDFEDQSRSVFAVAWMECSMAVHIFSTKFGIRGSYARAIAASLAKDGEINLSDGSPLLITASSYTQTADYLKAGQVKLTGRYGRLRRTEKKKQIVTIENKYHSGG